MILMLMMALQQVIITTENVDMGTVDNQENVEPDKRKDPARFAFFRQVLQTFTAILMTALITTLMTTLTLSRMTDLEPQENVGALRHFHPYRIRKVGLHC